MAGLRSSRGAALLVAVAALVGCGDDSGRDDGGDSAAIGGADGPAPAEMCAAPLVPMVAAYDLQSGSYRWHVCDEGGAWYSLAAATDDVVFVSARPQGSEQVVLALDAGDGAELWRGDRARMEDELPADAARPTTEPPTIDGVALTGGQDDPLVGTDAATGDELWRNDDHLTYDDVWAVADGAVYMSHDWGQVPNAIIRAYDVRTGATRWERTLDQRESYPWWVDDGRVFSLWDDLTVMSTSDGEILWHTSYAPPASGGQPQAPASQLPGMRGVLANGDSVFVSFASQPSGGD